MTPPCTFIGAILSHEDLKRGKDLHHYRSRHSTTIGGAMWMLTQVVNNFLQVAEGHDQFLMLWQVPTELKTYSRSAKQDSIQIQIILTLLQSVSCRGTHTREFYKLRSLQVFSVTKTTGRGQINVMLLGWSPQSLHAGCILKRPDTL